MKTVSCREKFNENFRATYEYDKEYVQFIAEHKELIGEKIESGQNHLLAYLQNTGKCLQINLCGDHVI